MPIWYNYCGDKMKKVLTTIFLFTCIILLFVFRNEISSYILNNYFVNEEELEYSRINNNEYAREYSYKYAKLTDDFNMNNEKEIINVIYTFLNSGMNKFIFWCDKNYSNCTSDVERITSDDEILGTLNNFVHPFNAYKKIYTTINTSGKITIEIEKSYTNEEIEKINAELDKITEQILYDGMTVTEKIKAFHDYLVNSTVYDKDLEDNNDYNNSSHKATGALFNKKAICSGYTDTMAIFLNRLNVNNYKISSSNHIWNLVLIDGTFLHLDLTWDDPTTPDGSNYLLHEFFLITTEKLENMNTGKHIYDKEIYEEAA